MTLTVPATVFVRAPVSPQLADAVSQITVRGTVDAVVMGSPTELDDSSGLLPVFGESVVCGAAPDSYLAEIVVGLARAHEWVPLHVVVQGLPRELEAVARERIKATGVGLVGFV